MKKITRIVSLLLVAVMLFGMTACSNTPDYSVDETLQKGYAMLDPAGEKTRSFTLTITQGEKYAYTFNGRISDGSIMSSLTVSRNGLKSNHKNLFLVNGTKLHVSMNGAMSAAESEIGFVWTDTSALQNRYLTIDNGYTMVKEVSDAVKTSVFTNWATTRNATSNGKGDYQYNLTYSGETLTNLMSTLLADSEKNAATLTTKIDDNIKTVTGKSFELFETSMRYYQDMVDIDTEEVLGDYETNGVHFNNLLKQELTALQTLMSKEGSYISEQISLGEGEDAYFKHVISFCDKDGKAFGKIELNVSNASVDKIDPSIYNYIAMEDFVGAMQTNIKNAKGVGYEKHDFPYVATYTANQLTLTETNDLYKAVHVWDFERGAITKYTVTIYTYDLKMHDALSNKYNGMNMKFETSTTDALENGTGSGVLQFTSDAIGTDYLAKDPITLLELLKEVGIPTYAQ